MAKKKYGYLIEYDETKLLRYFKNDVVPYGYKNTWCSLNRHGVKAFLGIDPGPYFQHRSRYYYGLLPYEKLLWIKLKFEGIKNIWRIDLKQED